MRALLMGASLLALGACQADTSTKPTSETQTQPASKTEIVRTPTKMALFGDLHVHTLHVHTRNSFDAYIFGTRADADAAYRFAKGEPMENGKGKSIQLDGPPLDFFSVTDHAEYLGIVPEMARRGSDLSKTETGKSIFGLLATDRRANFLRIGQTIVTGEELTDIYDHELMDSVWADTVKATEAHNEPGVFTTFAGYEFTAMRRVTDTAAANLHRNVIFENEAPKRLFSTLDSIEPADLWVWMEGQRKEGRDSIAIPHNSNASNGMMFTANLSADAASARIENEPLAEITQIKGTSETHPLFSPNDEWADFEQYENLIGSTEKSTPEYGSFIRQTLALHPHNRQSTPPDGKTDWPEDYTPPTDLISTPQYGASGLAGVWAEANTREDIFKSMRAKETFGTSGPRMKIRLFALQDRVGKDILKSPNMIEQAYEYGTPMGGAMKAIAAPKFLAWAARDVNSAPLERLQIIKVWMDGDIPQEKVIDIACAEGVPSESRCDDQDLSIDISNCTRSGVGASELKTLWADPDYKPDEKAAYYLRVLEAPKCRWSTWDAVRRGSPPNPEMKATVQDRAWSSAIWVE